uniref:Klotho n=1 Tax=Pseudonaja textilis TaxID=8673 RepID=A0A670YCU5_PSETE
MATSFLWGAGSAAYQVEGAWNRDGKGPSVLDTLMQRSAASVRNPAEWPSWDSGSSSYDHVERDLDGLSALAVSHYRFSLAWARLLPNGTAPVNLAAIRYDGVTVMGYTVWSLMDGFEWFRGYVRRGLFYVDFQSQDKKMIMKSSGLFYRKVIQDNESHQNRWKWCSETQASLC